MSILSIQPLTTEIELTLFQDGKMKKNFHHPKNGNELDSFPEALLQILEDEWVDEIWCITGPGPFTLMRIITLTLNTLHLTRWIRLKEASFFEWIKTENIPILEANTREYIIQENGSMPELRAKESLDSKIYEWIFQKNDFTDAMQFIEYREDYENMYSIFQSKPFQKSIQPLYFKAPNITKWSKKNT
jgi:tRNA A37 threonylcarbamoyladenosine modification protein TsaB